MKAHILLIEDDPQQSESIKRIIENNFKGVSVTLLETECDFYIAIQHITSQENLPSLVICDVMLPWTFPSPDAPSPSHDIVKGTFRKAGLRCWKRFREREAFKNIPWIYFTVLDEQTIDLKSHRDEKTVYTQKAGSIDPLIEQIKSFQGNHWPETADEVSKKLLNSPTMRNILLAGLSLPLSDCLENLK
jgi:CheY-like chemotaxis protein